jgi:hypothetical protein
MKQNSQYGTADGFRFAKSLCFGPALSMLAWISILMLGGCGTTTTRIATEQLLISDAVDQAISQIDFQKLRGEKVFLDTQYLNSVKGVGFVNSEYIISSLRQQLTGARCLIQDAREMADIIVEPRVGALGTDGHEVVYGIPQSGSITSAAAILSNSPIPAIPEISIGKSNAQSGIAKVIVFAYDRETRSPVWQSGIAKAEATSSNNWYFGAGPFQKGSIYEKGVRFAGQKLAPPPHLENLASERWQLDGLRNRGSDVESIANEPPPTPVGYGQEHVFARPLVPLRSIKDESSSDVATAGGKEAKDAAVKKASHKESVDDK